MKNSKKQKLIKEEIKEKTIHKLEEAVDISKKFASKKFDESLDISIILGIDAKKSDQQIRGVTSLPKMPKKTSRLQYLLMETILKKQKQLVLKLWVVMI